MVARFNGRNPRAERWLLVESSRLITGIVNEQREAIQEVLEAAMRAGRGPRSVALDIVGRINKATGRRTGGLVGLTKADQRAVSRALSELRSGDPVQMANYLTRKTRDRRFDGIVRRAMRDGKPVQADQARKITGRMADRLLYRRGETIARTELLKGLHAAQNEGIMQLVDSGVIKQEQVTNEWDAANDPYTRDSHRAMDGQKRPLGEPFVSGLGNQLLYPGDTSLGAPAEDVVNCRCVLRQSIDFVSELRPGD